MTIELNAYEVYREDDLRSFFMRGKAIDALEKLLSLAKDEDDLFDELENQYVFFEDLEDDLYTKSTEELIEEIGEEYFNLDKEE